MAQVACSCTTPAEMSAQEHMRTVQVESAATDVLKHITLDSP